MLSKSQARMFFVGGTVIFSLLFLLLTVDTIRKVPAQTRAHAMTDAVKRGKLLWDKNNCMGCHTLLGEGAYYAPELTKVVARRGEMWLKLFLRDPQAMFPGERKMVQYNFTPKQIDDLIAFFRWIGKMDLNGFPPKPGLKPQERRSVPPAARPQAAVAPRRQVVARARLTPPRRPGVTTPRPAVARGATSRPTSAPTSRPATAPRPAAAPRQPAPVAPKVVARPAHFAICSACHMVAGSGGKIGPALDGVGKKYNKEYLKKWLTDPQSVKPGSKMPRLALTPTQIAELVEYLSSLR